MYVVCMYVCHVCMSCVYVEHFKFDGDFAPEFGTFADIVSEEGFLHLNFSGPFSSIYSASKFRDLEGVERKAGQS